MIEARLLRAGDEAALDEFLMPQTEYCFLMRSNAAQAGVVFASKPYQADYFAAFEGAQIIGVIAQTISGYVQVFLPHAGCVAAVAGCWRAHLAAYPRKLIAFLGPAEQVAALLHALDWSLNALRYQGSTETLFRLVLSNKKSAASPSELQSFVRRAVARDIPALIAWRYDYYVEALREPPGQATYERAIEEINRRVDEQQYFVLDLPDHGLVSFCAIAGTLPKWRNIGPVGTLPVERNKGYASAVLIGALKVIESEGITNVVLFTDDAAAEKIYRNLGFEPIGDWMFDFLITPTDRI